MQKLGFMHVCRFLSSNKNLSSEPQIKSQKKKKKSKITNSCKYMIFTLKHLLRDSAPIENGSSLLSPLQDIQAV